MKKTIVYVLVVSILCSLLALCLTGCGENVESRPEPRFKIVDDDIRFHRSYACLVVDTETGVLYLYDAGQSTSVMTVLVDAEGKPLLWEGDLDG